MSATIDERTAWNLVRATPRDLTTTHRRVCLPHNPSPDAWLQVDPSGQWNTSTPVSAEARDILELYLPLQVQGRLTVAQLGQSLDGRIATESGHSHYITGTADIVRLHRLRALVDAVVVGAGTIASDDPRLTVREVEGDNPVRVVLDPDGRLDPTRRVFADGSARTVHVRREMTGTDPQAREDDASVLVLPVDAQGRFEPTVVLSALHDLGLTHVLIEGGGVTVSRFLQARAVDRLHVTVAPLIIGSGKPAFTLDPVDTLEGAWRPPCRVFRLGQDVLFDLDLREPGVVGRGVSGDPRPAPTHDPRSATHDSLRMRPSARTRAPGRVESSTRSP